MPLIIGNLINHDKDVQRTNFVIIRIHRDTRNLVDSAHDFLLQNPTTQMIVGTTEDEVTAVLVPPASEVQGDDQLEQLMDIIFRQRHEAAATAEAGGDPTKAPYIQQNSKKPNHVLIYISKEGIAWQGGDTPDGKPSWTTPTTSYEDFLTQTPT